MKKIRQILKSKNEDQSIISNEMLDRFYGYNKTLQQQKPIDASGAAIPWYTYPAMEFIEQFDFSEKKIFEWGSGNSSVYFSIRNGITLCPRGCNPINNCSILIWNSILQR